MRVLRGGALVELPAQQIVPGDVILLEAGNLVPADARLLESVNLRIQEATLTGESEPVEKEVRALPDQDLTIGDRRNMAYMGTVVTYGRGKALIVETGMHTELGKVASLLQNVGNELTPLQKRLDQLGKLLAVVGFAVSALIFFLGLMMRRAAAGYAADRGQRRSCHRARRAAGGGDHHPGHRRAAHAQAQSPDPQAAGGGNARLGNGDLLG